MRNISWKKFREEELRKSFTDVQENLNLSESVRENSLATFEDDFKLLSLNLLSMIINELCQEYRIEKGNWFFGFKEELFYISLSQNTFEHPLYLYKIANYQLIILKENLNYWKIYNIENTKEVIGNIQASGSNLSWGIHEDYRAKGIMKTILKDFISDVCLIRNYIKADISNSNLASINLAKSCGLVQDNSYNSIPGILRFHLPK